MGRTVSFEFGRHDVFVPHVEADVGEVAEGVEGGVLDVGEHDLFTRTVEGQCEFGAQLT